jgi:transcriptional regulator with XRE-family HTH domain
MNDKLLEIGSRIKLARKNLKLSQAELSELLDISPSHMSDIENGKKNIGIEIFMRMTETLGVSADWLLRTDTPKATQISNDEFSELLSDCTPTEREMLFKILKDIKEAIMKAKREPE